MVFPGWITWYYEPFFINNGVQLVTAEGKLTLLLNIQSNWFPI